MVVVTSPQPNELEQKKKRQTLERAKASHLSKQLQTRLQYAKLKVEYGWQRQNLNEVENLYFHHSHLRSSTRIRHVGPYGVPSVEKPRPPFALATSVHPGLDVAPALPDLPAEHGPSPPPADDGPESLSPPLQSQSPPEHATLADTNGPPSLQLPTTTATLPTLAFDLSDPALLARLAQLQAQMQAQMPSLSFHPPPPSPLPLPAAIPLSTSTPASRTVPVPVPVPVSFPGLVPIPSSGSTSTTPTFSPPYTQLSQPTTHHAHPTLLALATPLPPPHLAQQSPQPSFIGTIPTPMTGPVPLYPVPVPTTTPSMSTLTSVPTSTPPILPRATSQSPVPVPVSIPTTTTASTPILMPTSQPPPHSSIAPAALTYDSFWSTHASSTGPTRALYRTHTGFMASATPTGNVVAMLTPGGHSAVLTTEGVYVGGGGSGGGVTTSKGT